MLLRGIKPPHREDEMMKLLSVLRAFDLRQLGNCPFCMRVSFQAMAAAWITATTAIALHLDWWHLSMILAALLSAVWLAHIVGRAIRSSIDVPDDQGRRVAIGRMLKAIGAAAAISVAFPRSAHADSGCGGWAGNSGCPRGCLPCQRQRSDCSCTGNDRSCGQTC